MNHPCKCKNQVYFEILSLSVILKTSLDPRSLYISCYRSSYSRIGIVFSGISFGPYLFAFQLSYSIRTPSFTKFPYILSSQCKPTEPVMEFIRFDC